MLTKETFVCNRTCADCCQKTVVKLNKEDIKRIKKAGYDDFLEFDYHIKKPVLKHIEGNCVFLGKKDDKYYCKIYNIRPRICKLYPFVEKDKVEDCKPKTIS